jgi:hypothetical protein
MRRTLFIVLFLVVGATARAQNGLTPSGLIVDEFDRLLAGIQHNGDTEAARQITEQTLRERASANDLARWQAEFKGEKARRALTAVVDMSEFLEPPASAIADGTVPTAAAQTEILDRTATYIKETLPRLPNFLAVRTTTRFDVATRKQFEQQEQISQFYQLTNWKPKAVELGVINGQSLFFVGEWQFAVTYRDGEEVSESQVGDNHHRPPLGLDTVGEFGPILTTVFGDARHGTITWSHWERRPIGQVAVFDYDVPKGESHYQVENVETDSSETPAYHGQFAIEPATGAIARITLTAEESESSATQESRISLEYGPVEIGGKTYICPLHGVAYSLPRTVGANGAARPDPQPVKDGFRYLNDVTFTLYHLFRPEVRILTDAPEH